MSILIRVAQFLLSLCILVLLHELGHFVMARIFRTRVEKFYIFFNPWFSLVKRKIGHTIYGIGWLPLGGYVKIAGMVDESFDNEQLAKPPEPWEFRSKPAWQRLLMVSGGVLVNLLLAWVIYSCLLFSHGQSYLASRDVRYGIVPDSAARAMGFESGDRILTVNGDTLENFADIMTRLLVTPGAQVEVERAGELKEVEIPRSALAQMVRGDMLFQVRVPMVIDSVIPGSAAEHAGLLRSDSLVEVDGMSTSFFDEFREAMLKHRGDSVSLRMARGDGLVDLKVLVPSTGLVGVMANMDFSHYFPISTRSYTLWQAVPAGATQGWKTLSNYWRSLKLLFVPEARAHESLGGFISIGKIFPEVWNWYTFWSLTAFLSLVLAVMNFLPIPGLDGGHALFIIYEMVTGRRPGAKFLMRAQMVGFVILIGLVLYANLNDVIRLFR